MGPADLSTGREAGEPNGRPYVASSLGFSDLGAFSPQPSTSPWTHTKVQAQPREWRWPDRRRLLLLTPPVMERKPPFTNSGLGATWLVEARSQQRLDTSPQLCVVSRPLCSGGRNVVRIVPPLVRLQGAWEVSPFCWILPDFFSASAFPSESRGWASFGPDNQAVRPACGA